MVWVLIVIVSTYTGYYEKHPMNLGEYATQADCIAVYKAARKGDSNVRDGTCVQVRKTY